MKQFTHIILIQVLLICSIQSKAQIEPIYLDDRDNYAKAISNHFQTENWGKGKKILDEALEEYPNDSDFRMLLGKYYFHIKNYDKARFELVKALEYNRDNVYAKQILVNVEIESARYSSAICYINELLEVNPYWKDLWNKKIEVYRLQGNHVEATRLLKRLNQIYPNDIKIKEAYLYYVEEEANSKKKQGRLDETVTLNTRMIEEAPFNEAYYLELINNCLKLGDYEKALTVAERGVFNIPNSIKLIDKKADILSAMNRYGEVFDFIKSSMKTSEHKAYLSKRYNYYTEIAARHYRTTDPYTLYSIIFEQNPRNEEAFNYVVNTATTSGKFDDALDAIKKVKTAKGEDKGLLMKELQVYKRMNAESKANQTIIRLYQLYPKDTDILYQYTLYQFEQGKQNMNEELYERALPHWHFVIEFGEEEMIKAALVSTYNCYFELGMFDNALSIADRLKYYYPDEHEWCMKASEVYLKQYKFEKALAEYEKVLQNVDPIDKERFVSGYEELVANCTKTLIEDYSFAEAKILTERWLKTNPQSKQALRYAINVSAHIKNAEDMTKYATQALTQNPDDIFFRIKMAEAHNLKAEYEEALDILSPAIKENPYHKDLINAHSQVSADYAKWMINDSKLIEGLAVIDNALLYDPKNRTLNYWKAIAYEKNKQYDLAYAYLQLYEPGLLEVDAFSRHLKFLKSKTYKNQIGLSYLHSNFGDSYEHTSVETIEYTRKEKKNAYTGRFNYAGRQEGKGVQGQVEWTRDWSNGLYSRIDVAMASKYFASFIASGSVYKSIGTGWEAELGAGYRRMTDKNNLINIVGGIAKELDPWWLNVRFNSFLIKSNYYYSLLGQARFEAIDNGVIYAMGSFGSAPDVDVINYDLYRGFSVTNVMLGAGGRYMINDRVTAGILGTCHNYESTKDENNNGKSYRSLYNIHFQLYVNF
ncbi:YaiO family outer membrane beta-barrel protein [Dysgonomonas sp. 216]|uniref:tetratricopeptide repeat protein n=1 Tax=Dysgonomonas sp. 216 TaxID=2302934 RepID=UPI0013D0EC81|nr:tetratricopeptide repeat protein [Dysgonomonas sp. 216]NDW18486.1 YaiO family outer membrane beta-barrel protein [Dysgonomonas sp. 216]